MDNLVKEIMTQKVIMIEPSLTVEDAAKKMKEENIGCLVVAQGNSPVGILTERDLVRRIIALNRTLYTLISKVMSSPLITIDPEQSFWELVELMKKREIHKVPVVRENSIVGIVTSTDLIKICSLGSDCEIRRISDQILLH